MQNRFKLHLSEIFVFFLFFDSSGVETRRIRIESHHQRRSPSQPCLLHPKPESSRAKISTKAESGAGCWKQPRCPLRTTRMIDQSHPTSPGLWPLPDSCCYCWWARPNAAATVYQPRWLRQARENTASFWLCADGKSSAQTNVRTIVWAGCKHPPASNCFHSRRIHFCVFPSGGLPKEQHSEIWMIYIKKNAVHKALPKLLVQLHWSPFHMAWFQLWCFSGICSLD